MARKMTFARSFLLVFPLAFVGLYLVGLPPAKVAGYSVLISLMLGWVIRILSRSPSRCLDSSLYEYEQIEKADQKRFAPDMEKAEGLKKEGDFAGAEKIVNNIIALRPQYVPGLWLKALILEAADGDKEEIKSLLRRVMENAPVEDKVFKLASKMHDQMISS